MAQRHLIRHDHALLGSTNDEALRLAGAGVPHLTLVTARQQTAGRGRQGRTWISPPGNLHASYLLRATAFPDFTAVRAMEIGFVAAVAAIGVLECLVPDARLKWPNDVLVGGAKIAGILVEMHGEAIIAGIGINVAHAPPGLPYPVTSLAALGVAVDVETVLAGLSELLLDGLVTWVSAGFAPVRTAWLERGPRLGDPLRAGANGEGVFAGLAEDGALLLRTPAGVRRIVGGEVLPGGAPPSVAEGR